MNLLMDTGASAPQFREVKRLLTAGLAAREWQPGERLPSETRLAERFGVSIGTVRKAIDVQVGERIVIRRQGHGRADTVEKEKLALGPGRAFTAYEICCPLTAGR